jgi:hypothetical protein
MTAEQDKVAAREIMERVECSYELDVQGGSGYVTNADEIEAAIASACAAARRLGAEEEQQRCRAKLLDMAEVQWENARQASAEDDKEADREACVKCNALTSAADAIRALPLPPEVSA